MGRLPRVRVSGRSGPQFQVWARGCVCPRHSPVHTHPCASACSHAHAARARGEGLWSRVQKPTDRPRKLRPPPPPAAAEAPSCRPPGSSQPCRRQGGALWPRSPRDREGAAGTLLSTLRQGGTGLCLQGDPYQALLTTPEVPPVAGSGPLSAAPSVHGPARPPVFRLVCPAPSLSSLQLPPHIPLTQGCGPLPSRANRPQGRKSSLLPPGSFGPPPPWVGGKRVESREVRPPRAEPSQGPCVSTLAAFRLELTRPQLGVSRQGHLPQLGFPSRGLPSPSRVHRESPPLGVMGRRAWLRPGTHSVPWAACRLRTGRRPPPRDHGQHRSPDCGLCSRCGRRRQCRPRARGCERG